jgi:hypothetical protein
MLSFMIEESQVQFLYSLREAAIAAWSYRKNSPKANASTKDHGTTWEILSSLLDANGQEQTDENEAIEGSEQQKL